MITRSASLTSFPFFPALTGNLALILYSYFQQLKIRVADATHNQHLMSIVSLNSLRQLLLVSLLLSSFTLGIAKPEQEENDPIIYVKASATGNNDGSSWGDAFTDLQDALAAANSLNQKVNIYVAQGTYYPTSGNDRSISFTLPANVNLEGGFKGDEVGEFIRGFWETFPTILSGNIGNKDSQADNSYHVLTAIDLSDRIAINGFIIKDGYADGSGSNRHGAGIYVKNISTTSFNSSINSCLFTQNIAANGDGGGLYIENANFNIGFQTYANNEARGDGGAICIRGASSIANIGTCDFIENTSRQEEGGAIAAFGQELNITRTAFVQNQSTQGGGIYTGSNTALTIDFSTFFKNQTGQGIGSGISARGNASVINCIFWQNTNTSSITIGGTSSITYTLAEESYPGEGNLSDDPLFAGESPLGISLSQGSPAIRAADNGNSAIGARPYYGDFPPELVVLRVKQDAIGNNSGSSWLNAFTSLPQAMERAKELNTTVEIWVAEGTYKPTEDTDRSISFDLSNDVNLLGGFAGNEQDKEERDPKQYPTILSGNLRSASIDDNTWHIIRADSLSAPALLDGFIITEGYATGSGNDRHGAGILLTNSQNLQITNCIFQTNRTPNGDGGAIYATNSQNITFRDCQFIANTCRGDGGAIYLASSSSNFTFFYTIFENNQSTEEDGGALATFGPNHQIFSSLFFKNKAPRGGAIYNATFGTIDIQHSTLTKNEADPGLGSAIYTRGTFTSTLSIYWNNTPATPIQSDNPSGIDWEVNLSIVEGGWNFKGEGNLNQDPLFSNESLDNFQLLAGSPALDVSNASSFPYTDLVGNPRILNGKSDMGAYEFRGEVCGTSERLYVDIDANGLENGSSWINAYSDLQDALAEARSCETVKEIWIAEGTYFPSQTGNPDDIFRLVSEVSVYGGFSGGETDLSQRDWQANETILSGFIDCNEANSDCDARSDVVVIGEDLAEGTIIDGFTVTGAANGLYISNNLHGRDGGGMILTVSDVNNVCKPTIQNCRFINNDVISGDGGGIYVFQASPIIQNCQFISNFAETDGAGLFLFGTEEMKISNCSFIRNICYFAGGGIASYIPNLEVENSLFSNGFAEIDGGGAIYTALGSNLTVRNCTFTENDVDEGEGSVFYFGGTTLAYNSIFWRNGKGQRSAFPDDFDPEDPFNGNLEDLVLSHCIYQDGWPGFNNIDADPLFIDVSSRNFNLLPSSPAINAGINSEVILPLDLAGNSRIVNGTVDIGAYEFGGTTCTNDTILFVDIDAEGLNDGSSWENAFTNLHDALAEARNCEVVKEIWVAEGTYQTTTNKDEEISFELVSGVKMYGGFNGTEIILDDRNWISYPVTLTGHGGQFTIDRIIKGKNLDSNTVIDGFIISEGYNDHGDFDVDSVLTGNEKLGAGMFLVNNQPGLVSKPFILNCVFEGNMTYHQDGAAINLYRVYPVIENCSFLGNFSDEDAGAIYAVGNDSLVITNSIFTSNVVWEAGGAIFSRLPFIEFQNCGFYYNFAENGFGGAIANLGEVVLKNCNFYGNQVEDGGTAAVSGGQISAVNSIFWNNGNQSTPFPDPNDPERFEYRFTIDSEAELTFCIYQGGWPGAGNLDQDPMFVDVANLDFTLLPSSPAINAGLNAAVTLPIDLAGNPRIIEGTVDIGAYEFQDIISSVVTRFFLKDADSDLTLQELTDGTILNYENMGSINVEALTEGNVASVKFELQGPLSVNRTENRIPWALFGDRNGDFSGYKLFPGQYSLRATPYSLAGAVGQAGTAKEISFEVFGTDASLVDNPFLIKLYPNPTSGITTFNLPNDWQGATTFRLIDNLGNEVWNSTLPPGKRSGSINLSPLTDGLYVLEVRNAEKTETTKVIIYH